MTSGKLPEPRRSARLLRTWIAALTILAGLTVLAILVVGNASRATGAPSEPGAHAPAIPTIPVGSEGLPAGASVQTFTPNLGNAIAMAFDPSDPSHIFYTVKQGTVRLIINGVLQGTPVITFAANSSGERGLLGIAMDPNFGGSNRYIYVYYTSNDQGQCGGGFVENKVVRFEENGGVGTNPQEIFDSCQSAGNHVGGNIHFGPDGKLYISIGDNANAANSQLVGVEQGKTHRINSDGTIPPDNPVFTQTGAIPSLYAMGLRNSFDFGFDPLDATAPYRIFMSENGPGCDDEMNRIEAGYNYGWRSSYPCDDGGSGPDPTYNTIPPLWFQPSGSCCVAPTGITVYSGSQVSQWQNHLFMCSYNDSTMRHFYLSGDRLLATNVNSVTGVACNMDIETGPDGALYYIQGGGYSNGTLMRIVGSGGPSSTPTRTRTSTATRTSTSTTTPTVTATPTCTLTSNYNVTRTSGNQVIPASNLVPGSICNNCTVPITLPFPFSIYDQSFTSANVSPKGSMQFVSNVGGGANVCLPATNLNYAILPFWDDFNANPIPIMGVYTELIGTAPNRIFVVQWRMANASSPGAPNWEVLLFEGQPHFDIIYGGVPGRGQSATIGAQEATGTGFRSVQWSCNMVSVQSGDRLIFDRRTCP